MSSAPSPSYTTGQKLDIFRRCFSGLGHAYGTYDTGTRRIYQVKEPVTDRVFLQHLRGERPYGVYLLAGANTRAAVADFDHADLGPPTTFIQVAREWGIDSYLERSKSKGWHVWVFFQGESGVPAAKARRVVKEILHAAGAPATEVFPKQDQLTDPDQFGNFIFAPLFGKLVPQGRMVFVDLGKGFAPYANQWAVLEAVRRVPESALDRVLESRKPAQAEDPPRPPARPHGEQAPFFGLPPCARKMLAQGVVEYQRESCFLLAVHLKRAGLPHEAAMACLRVWATKNKPLGGKRVIIESEITEQAASAYKSSYHACGCERSAVQPFCDPACPIRHRLGCEKPSQAQTR